MPRSLWKFAWATIIVACCSCDGLADDASTEINEMLRAYVQAFNQGDADAIGNFWTEDAVWEDDETGVRVSGRDALVEDFRTYFDENPDARLSGEVVHVKMISDGIASVDGTTFLMMRDEEPVENTFTAVVVKQDDQWRMSKVDEAAAPAGEAWQQLKELDSMVGEWVDDGDAPRVSTTVRWGANRSFLIRSYVVEEEDGSVSQGTQVVGWDPRQRRIRSWTFESDGSFGEATWARDGAEWIGRMQHTLVDGGAASATQIIREIDPDTLEVETVGLQVNGEPQPSGEPVRVLRVAERHAEAPAEDLIPSGTSSEDQQ